MTGERRAALALGVAAAAVTIAGGVPRILLAAGALPDALRPFVWSDALFTYVRGLSGHRLPYADTPFEYPPVIGGISAVFSLLASGPVPYVVAWILLLAGAAGVVAYLLAGASSPRRTLVYWSLAPQLFLLATVNFDVIPTLLLTAAAIAQRRGRERWSAVALAAGTAAKLFPGASVPLAFARARSRAAFAIAFAAVLVGLYLPSALQPYSSLGGVGFYAVGIPANLDSVWGTLERLLATVGVSASAVVILVVTSAGLAATYVLGVIPRARRASDPAVGFALATIALLFWSRLYSPQYSLWLLPFLALLGVPRRLFVLLTIADAGVFFTIYPLTLARWSPDEPFAVALLGALAGFVLLRHATLVLVWRRVSKIAEHGSGAARGERGDREQ